MDWRGRACGLASQVTRPHTNGPLPMGKPWFTRRQLILKRLVLPVPLWQQQSDFLSVHGHLSFVIVGCVLRTVAICLNICSKLIRNTTFFRDISVILFDYQPWSYPLWRYVALRGRMADKQSLDKNSFCFRPSYHLTRFGNGVFHTLYQTLSCVDLRTGLHVVVNRTPVVHAVLSHHTDTSYPSYKNLYLFEAHLRCERYRMGKHALFSKDKKKTPLHATPH